MSDGHYPSPFELMQQMHDRLTFDQPTDKARAQHAALMRQHGRMPDGSPLKFPARSGFIVPWKADALGRWRRSVELADCMTPGVRRIYWLEFWKKRMPFP